MPNTLIAWEMGGGLGHVGPLRAVAAELARRGHTVRVAAANGALCERALPGVEVVPCPRLPVAERLLRVPCTLADVLHDSGYASRERVVDAVGRWLALLDRVRADLLLADYSPTAMLATRGRRTPTAVIGSGFVCPRDLAPLPSLHGVVREPHWAREVEGLRSPPLSIPRPRQVRRVHRPLQVSRPADSLRMSVTWADVGAASP